MVIYRLPDGRLWLHSVIALDEAGMAQLDALGPVAFVVVPSRLHRLDAPVFAERYPEAKVVCAAEARVAVAAVVEVDEVVEEALRGTGVVVHKPGGLVPGERVYELPVEGGVVLVFCDALFNVPHLPGCGGWVMRLLGSSGFFGTTRIGRALTTDLAAWRGWLEEQSRRPDIVAISVAHGDPIVHDAAARLAEAAARLA